MAFAKTLAALQLMLLLVGSFSSYATAAIAKKYPIAVEGLVYCRKCKLPGFNKDINASPIPGAIAKLRCKISGEVVVVNGTTDHNGYFLIQAPGDKVSNYVVEKCIVILVSSPLPQCQKPSTLNGGKQGAVLKYEVITVLGKTEVALYTTGLLMFAPTNSTSC